MNTNWSEIVVPRSNGEAVFSPGIQKKALRTIKRSAHGIGNNNSYNGITVRRDGKKKMIYQELNSRI